MPKTATPRTPSLKTRRLYEAAKAQRGNLSGEAQAVVRVVRGQSAANRMGAARMKSKAF